ncbi:unnamed protein product [Polarella glacialis]|uniref:1,3-beta-glucan synthase component FKS1-like domain-containing protein n=1 Tax=Polarella glacialis TaxID=89957 RepID=A0A813JEF5_POLGL|nr:unnamed protein product [Polarella glacialis]
MGFSAALSGVSGASGHLALDEAFVRELKGLWMSSTLRELPGADAWASRAARSFAGLQAAFDFQKDSVRNQFEHLLSLWRSHCAVRADRLISTRHSVTNVEQELLWRGLEELHEDLLRGFLAWRQRFQRSAQAATEPGSDAAASSPQAVARNDWWRLQKGSARQEAQARVSLEEVATFLLVWGEAGNLRFMPELLYFLTELTLDAEEEGPSGVRGHRQSSDFLVSIVRPIYKVVFDEHYQRVDVVNGQHRKVMRPGYETFLPADSSNYDDWNELFCDTDRLTSALVFGAERGQLVALPPARRYAALSRVVWDVSLRGAKTHRELHSMWGVFAAMHRIWFLHVLLYFLSMFWVASRNFHDEQSGWDTLVGGGSPLVCLAAVGLLVPVHAVCWNLARWFVAGRALRDKLLGRGGNSTGCVRCLRSLWLMLSCLLQLALWSLPLVTFGLVRWLDAFGKDDPDEKGTHFGFLSLQEALCLHLGMCCCGVLVILLLPARAEDQQWAPTSSHWSLKIGRWLFWGLVLSAKVFSSLEGISAIHNAMDEMKISRLGRESVSDLPRFAFGPMWDKDMIQWLALWGAGFVFFLADTQFWFCLGCSLLAALLALSQRGWQLFSLTFQDAVAAVPELFAERVLLDAAPGRQRPLPWQPRAPSAAGLPRDSARRHQWFSPWFPDIWNRAIEFMRYEDKLDDFMAGQLRFNFNTDDAQQVNWAHLHRRLERRTSFTPPQILRPSSWGQRCLGRDLGWLPDENWPANREVQWRLQGLSRGLFLADLPKPFQTPYLPGFTVMIPHYGESILLCKSDLYASNQG